MTEPTGSVVQTAAVTETSGTATGRPTVIVDNLHIRYRVFATGRPAGSRDQGNRFLKRSPSLRRAREVHALRGVSFTAYEGEADRKSVV